MYTVLSPELADVNESIFEHISNMSPSVLVAPIIDQKIAIKGGLATKWDDITECQNTLYLHLESAVDSPGEVSFEDPLIPGRVFRYIGEEVVDCRNEHFVELRYEVIMGKLQMLAFFLIPASECEFAVFVDEDCQEIAKYEFDELTLDGYIKKVKK